LALLKASNSQFKSGTIIWGRSHYVWRAKIRDVIVVGAGPAGTAAAKRCAEHGLDTVMVEKRALPRDKVCSGMIIGPVAYTLVKQEFGDVPKNVLSQPDHLDGYMFHVPGAGSQKLDHYIQLSWRRNLDYWMNQQAQAKGVEIWQDARVSEINWDEQGFSVKLERSGRSKEVKARFVVGADGAASRVRHSLFPELQLTCVQVYEECYEQELNLDSNYFHWIHSLEHVPAIIAVHRKDNITVIDFGHIIGHLKPFIAWAKDFIASNHNFNINQKPIWQGGCLEPIFPKGLINHTFLPARGNALLVGEAAGFVLPVTGEGIGAGIKSGLLAADSIINSIESGSQADETYLAGLETAFPAFNELIPWVKKLNAERTARSPRLLEVLLASNRDSLRTF
jgi:flavin-dependent dehydrogenase